MRFQNTISDEDKLVAPIDVLVRRVSDLHARKSTHLNGFNAISTFQLQYYQPRLNGLHVRDKEIARAVQELLGGHSSLSSAQSELRNYAVSFVQYVRELLPHKPLAIGRDFDREALIVTMRSLIVRRVERKFRTKMRCALSHLGRASGKPSLLQEVQREFTGKLGYKPFSDLPFDPLKKKWWGKRELIPDLLAAVSLRCDPEIFVPMLLLGSTFSLSLRAAACARPIDSEQAIIIDLPEGSQISSIRLVATNEYQRLAIARWREFRDKSGRASPLFATFKEMNKFVLGLEDSLEDLGVFSADTDMLLASYPAQSLGELFAYGLGGSDPVREVPSPATVGRIRVAADSLWLVGAATT